jgi:hypothetical protein
MKGGGSKLNLKVKEFTFPLICFFFAGVEIYVGS